MIDESIYVKFDEENYLKDSVDHSSSILDELTSFKSSEFLEEVTSCIPSITNQVSSIANNLDPETHFMSLSEPETTPFKITHPILKTLLWLTL